MNKDKASWRDGRSGHKREIVRFHCKNAKKRGTEKIQKRTKVLPAWGAEQDVTLRVAQKRRHGARAGKLLREDAVRPEGEEGTKQWETSFPEGKSVKWV